MAMSGMVRAVLLGVALVSGSVSMAAPARQVVTTEGVDNSGKDYMTIKDGGDLATCQQACLADDKCQAFTFNTKAKWCFLKSSVGDMKPFGAAVTGIVTTGNKAPVVDTAKRVAELGFLPKNTLDTAKSLAEGIARLEKPAAPFTDLVKAADDKAKARDFDGAIAGYAQALAVNPAVPEIWLRLASANGAARSEEYKQQQIHIRDALAAAVQSYLLSDGVPARLAALKVIGDQLGAQQEWKSAIRAYRLALSLKKDPALQDLYDKVVDEHGFRITDQQVDNNSPRPRICLVFSDRIEPKKIEPGDFVKVRDNDRLALSIEGNQICIDGVEHGGRYSVTVRDGLPAADGEKLARSATYDLYIRDRTPDAHFVGKAYVLPSGGEPTIPVVSVNTRSLKVDVLRISDRRIARTISDGTFLQALGQYEQSDFATRNGEQIFTGTVDVGSDLNKDVTTAIPVGKMVPKLSPGVYVLVARPNVEGGGIDSYGPQATQWFVVSDIGLSTFNGTDGLLVAARSLNTARPLAGVKLHLVAMDEDLLGDAVTDENGFARFDPGLLNGKDGKAATVLTAEQTGDYAFLDLSRPAFDLTDRGVGGRIVNKAVDVFMTPERGVYRPGETVHLTLLARDGKAHALKDVPLTLVVKRPDGVEHARLLAEDEGAGGRVATIPLPESAARGGWTIETFTDPKGAAVASTSVQVQDFTPERLDFAVKSDLKAFDPRQPGNVSLTAKYLYGAPAANLASEGEVVIQKADGVPGYEGWIFGLASDSFQDVYESFGGEVTDASGALAINLPVPQVPQTSLPLKAVVDVRLVDTSGRPVERQLTLPVASDKARIAIKPQFDDYAPDGGSAGFRIALVGPDGKAMASDGLDWQVKKIDANFIWYKADGAWQFERVENSSRIAAGTVKLATDPAAIEAQVAWGEYELEVVDRTGKALPASYRFEAGYYIAPKADDTPDALKVTLDKEKYALGDHVKAHVEGRFTGTALVMALSDHVVDMKVVEVPEGGADVDLPVTEKWGPGTYVTAELIRGMDLKAGRMPARAIGLAYAGVTPADRALKVRIDTPEKIEPRSKLDVALTVEGADVGSEAYVSVAAVDIGILNLTKFATPDPEDWYFGQRQLGVELRDLYGQLIDRTLGSMGAVHTGGDGAPLARLQGPPPTEKLVAFVSGVVKIGADGKVHVAFDIPDFNGSIRLTALAWSQSGVGHQARDVLVRDPIVATVAVPKFLGLGDSSRLALDLTHLDGPSGDVKVELAADNGVVSVESASSSQTLKLADKGKARVSFPVKGSDLGDAHLTATITTPDGKHLTKAIALGVRDNEPDVETRSVVTLDPGQSMTLNGEAAARLVPGTARITVSVGGLGVDVGGLVRSLDRYPYGCTEQLTSRALPLLYLDAVSANAGLGDDPALAGRVQKAIDLILLNEDSSGSFGLWGPGGQDLWLSAYVTDFLTRAREKGFHVPDVAFDLAVTHLRNQISYSEDVPEGGQAFAYAVYDLARNGRAAIGDLRYFADVKRDAFVSPLSLAQLGASLAAYGDKGRAATLFRAAAARLKDDKPDAVASFSDYGSPLRDAAALLALAAEARVDGLDLKEVQSFVNAAAENASLSTQEQSWLVLAANAALQQAKGLAITFDGQEARGQLSRGYLPETLTARPVTIANGSKSPVLVAVTTRGQPAAGSEPAGHGYAISGSYYNLKGESVDVSRVAQGTRLVAVLKIEATEPRMARLMVSDPLPAGFEIDSPALVRAGDVPAITSLEIPETVAYAEYRTDRFLAAVDRTGEDPASFQLAYMVRAVSPGRFVQPAAKVEDMYHPSFYAITGTGGVDVSAGK